MYETVDAINKGKYFWSAFQRTWPMPFDMADTDYAVLRGEDGKLSLVVGKEERLDELERTQVELRDLQEDAVLLAVTLGAELEYVNGISLGMAIDEVGAANALALYGPTLSGAWMQAPMSAFAEGDEQHG